MKKIRSNLIDIHNRKTFSAEIAIENGIIVSIGERKELGESFLLPGLIDAHVHIESSMVTPVEFSRVAVKHGTVGVVSDPHEIANVLGVDGVKFMLQNAAKTPLKILFGAPSCVPATSFETAGAEINAKDIETILEMPGIGYLSEMMNYPGVVNEDPEVLKKIALANKKNIPIDGHAPGVRGETLIKYVEKGISTDHECFTYKEALEKIQAGMHILIREGSGAKNFETLIPLLKEFPERIMFCTDDLHPDDLLLGHINILVKRALDMGFDLYDSIRAAGFNAHEHYRIPAGMLRVGDPADFIIIDSLEDWNILSTYIEGEPVYSEGKSHIKTCVTETPNKFNRSRISNNDVEVLAKHSRINVIKAIDGELVTERFLATPSIYKGRIIPDTDRDILKIVVVNRYEQIQPSVAFVKGFQFKSGAIGSSIAHDSHNIICVGTNDQVITETINWIIDQKGGIAFHNGKVPEGLPLEIAGILSKSSVESVAKTYRQLSDSANKLGSGMKAPFMTLAFMALLVIPKLKLGDKGLFDGERFSFVSLFSEDQ